MGFLGQGQGNGLLLIGSLPIFGPPRVYSIMHFSSWSRWKSVLKGARFIYGSMSLHLRDALCQGVMWTLQTGSVLYCLFILLPYQLPRAEESFLSGIIDFLTPEPEHLDHHCAWFLAARVSMTNPSLVPAVLGAPLTALGTEGEHYARVLISV